jgi:hypothetical protein
MYLISDTKPSQIVNSYYENKGINVVYLEEEDIRAQQILSGEDKILDEEMEVEEEGELSEEELDEKLKELDL